MAFVRGINPVWLFADLTAHLFDDTFYMFVLQNDLPYNFATVYHTSTGTPWTNPIRFFANGTLPIDIYFDPGTDANPVFYRLEFRQGPTQADPLIYLVQNYSPIGASGSTPITSVATVTTNQVTNPQFALINFQSPLTILTAGTYEIAPGWFLDLTGTGTATVEQTPLNSTAGLINPTNAPYALHLVLAGWDGATLRQRFQQNGMLWTSSTGVTRYVASSLTAKINGVSQTVFADLVDSMGAPLGNVLRSTVISTAWTEYVDNLTMPITTDTDTPPAAYIDYRLHFEQPGNANLFVTSIQLVSTNIALNFPYFQDSVDRQIDQTFHYYKEPLAQKPIPSYTLGWDFPYNPTQFFGNNIPANGDAGANKSYYICDQTILFQTVGNVMTETITQPGGLTLSTSSNTSFALIQYLDASTANEILLGRIAAQIKGYILNGAQNQIHGNISLWWTDGSIPTIPSSLVTSVSSSGVPTISGTWTEVPRGNLGNASFILPSGTDPVIFNQQGQVFSFNEWDARGSIGSAPTAFAIVVAFENLVAGSQAVIRYCSLMSGDISTPPAPLNAAEILQALQYYYRSSFLYGTPPGDNAGLNTGETYGSQAKGTAAANTPGPIIRFDQYMRAVPLITLFNPSAGTAGRIYDVTTATTWSASSVSSHSENGFVTLGTTDAGSTIGNQSSVHWTADARLGIV